MNLITITEKLRESSLFHSEDEVLNKPTVIGYEKKFKWSWMATQMNTFIVATDFGSEKVTVELIEQHVSESFKLAKKNYTGWPRGLQSGLGVISVMISQQIEKDAEEYCRKLKTGKKWAGFSIPVGINAGTKEVYQFEKNPMWGRIYYPHFKKLINNLKP